MKKLLLFSLSCLFSVNLSAQWDQITNLTGTTQNYNGVNVSVTSAGSSTTGGGCGGLYWTPQSDDSYTFTFSTPVAGVKIDIDAINANESVEFLINGQMFPILDCNLDANPFLNNCSVGNCSIVNGQFVNNTTTMWVCGGALTFYGPINTFTVREPIGGSGATFNISFAPVGTNIGGCIVQGSIGGDFTMYANSTCSGTDISVITSSYTSGMSMHTYFGDGTMDITAISSGTSGGYAYVSHEYPASGNYVIKQVFYDNGNAVDSLTMTYEHLFCTNIPLEFYKDLNSNCTFDNTESNNLPLLIEVDSNNTHIDTLSATSGLFYKAYGNPGDVYDFKLIGLPGDMVPVCPSTGEVSFTLQNLVYYTSSTQMGVGCGTYNNFDLGVDATFITAANRLMGHITAFNTHCLPQSGTLTMTFSPKYEYTGMVTPPPTSQTANTISWNLSGLSAFTNDVEYLYVNLPYNGQLLTIGDTVHTTLSITPTTGDINTLNNIIIREDTVTGPFDPNAIYVSPGNCVVPGTRLSYTVTFENMGNAPAENIYIMDTLSNGFDMSSMKLISASHQMNVTKLNNGGYNILKFEFPNINLPGSTSPDRHGMVKYEIDMVDNFPIGSAVTNKAGIYFDYMPAVLTNVASTVACWPVTVPTTGKDDKVLFYPNPASDELTIKAGAFTSCAIANSVGQVVLQRQLNTGKEVKLDLKGLAPGIYNISLKGDSGTEVRKFVKM